MIKEHLKWGAFIENPEKKGILTYWGGGVPV